MANYRVSSDIGGTFTDFVVQDDQGGVFVGKVPTTPENPALGVLAGIKHLVPDPSDIQFFVHGTTVGLNAFLERRGARVLLLMTKGVADTYTIARGHREKLYELHYRKQPQLAPRSDVCEISERVGPDGEILTPLDETDFDDVIQRVEEEKIPSIAVCFLHSYRNPAHELQAEKILKEKLPNTAVSLSHRVAPEWREVERASSTVMNAYVSPVVEKYLKTLKNELVSIGVDKTVHVMKSNGGVMTDAAASGHPISTLMSGPVGGSIGGVELSKQTGLKDLLCVDMGGTSFDLSLVVDGKPQVSNETVLEGLPLLVQMVDIETVGAGGGSLAWIESDGLRVGPQSAGSVPGPACYGRGGTQPTVTDANLFLGRLGVSSLLDGKMTLDLAASRSAMASVAEKLNITAQELAEGIVAIGNAKMADAMRTITVGRGIDPRRFTLVAFGGAGPMHAVELARELEISNILIPRFPGTFSAWGMLQSDIRHDLSRSFFSLASEANIEEVENAYGEMEREAIGFLQGEKIDRDQMTFLRSVDARYVGQEYTVSVSVSDTFSSDNVVADFHTQYQERYGHSQPAADVEFINLRIAAVGSLRREQGFSEHQSTGNEAVQGERRIIFDGVEHDAQIYKRAGLQSGQVYRSPAVVEEDSATTVIPPGYSFVLDRIGNVIITLEESK